MHSSRMRTVSCSGRLMKGVGVSARGVLPRGVSARGVPRGRGCLPRGVCVLRWGVIPQGVVCLGGMSAWGVSACVLGRMYTSPLLWTEFLTHVCENITFPQLRLRTVKIMGFQMMCNQSKRVFNVAART